MQKAVRVVIRRPPIAQESRSGAPRKHVVDAELGSISLASVHFHSPPDSSTIVAEWN
jgi:hypothetical protein